MYRAWIGIIYFTVVIAVANDGICPHCDIILQDNFPVRHNAHPRKAAMAPNDDFCPGFTCLNNTPMANPTKIETVGRVKRTVVAYLNGTALESLDNRQSSESYVLAKFYPPIFNISLPMLYYSIHTPYAIYCL